MNTFQESRPTEIDQNNIVIKSCFLFIQKPLNQNEFFRCFIIVIKSAEVIAQMKKAHFVVPLIKKGKFQYRRGKSEKYIFE